ncbi:hypothetical protein DM01DRAFT_1209187 [Hesseltinella vesiculosa]|uniref:Uncharacterized protein n=1 Tax=Hesseltinella vesiculosa TaxID=101127 RepID=A0A1X2GQ09_9FUNG|nr:hypothetical protein DM01DRAFT_1209187 [Hesseltinella vesiculosa]
MTLERLDQNDKPSVLRDFATALKYPDQKPTYIQQHQSVQQQRSLGLALLGTPNFIDAEFRSRVCLALRSSLPNEVDWAFNTLIKVTFMSENFTLDHTPSLLDDMAPFVKPFFDHHVFSLTDDSALATSSMDLFNDQPDKLQLERVLQVFHVLRNLSFQEASIRHIMHHQQMCTYLVASVTRLDPASALGELMRNALDILENLSPLIILHDTHDPFLNAMTALIFSHDRCSILSGLRALTRMAVPEPNEHVILSAKRPDLFDRLFELLMIDDEELTASTLEYVYQYSSLRSSRDWLGKLLHEYPGNLIGLLVGYLSYKSPIAPAARLNDAIHGIPKAQLQASLDHAYYQVIPDLQEYESLEEPYRCLGWLKQAYAKGGDDDQISFKDIYLNYQDRFKDASPFNVQEFSTVLRVAFPQPRDLDQQINAGSSWMDLSLLHIKVAPRPEDEGKRWQR